MLKKYQIICNTCGGLHDVEIETTSLTHAWKCPHCYEILRTRLSDLRQGRANRITGMIYN